MSKIKKKPVDQTTLISEKDIKLVKIIQFAGWVSLLSLAGFFGAWILLDWFLKFINIEFINIELNEITFSFIVFTATTAALCFGLSTLINNNRDMKKEYFIDWLIGEFLLCMFAIFSVAIYEW